jgi:hypothetical protein
MKNDDGCRVHFSCIHCRLGRNSESLREQLLRMTDCMKHKANHQGNIIHAVHNNTLMLWRVLGDTSQMSLEDVVTV